MNEKAEKAVRAATKAVRQEVREAFEQDFNHFTTTLLKMNFTKRLKFCFSVMVGKRPSAG